MKTIVSVQEVSEFDIKPPAALARWREMAEGEIRKRWADRSRWTEIDWPMNEGQDKHAFERLGFSYMEASPCGSLYAPRRPSEEELWWWYRESAPARFWREEILPLSHAARLEKISRPRADWVLDGVAEYAPNARRVVDISTHGLDVLSIVAAEHSGFREIIAAGITADLEGYPSSDRIDVHPARVAELRRLSPVEVVVAIDALDRAVDPGLLCSALEEIISPGGLLFLTATVASGFEIQALWDLSPTVTPPDRLNLPTVAALQKWFAGPAWEILELSTPGMFDPDAVRRVMKQNPERHWPRVLGALVDTDEDGTLVEFLQSRRLATFARLVARRLN